MDATWAKKFMVAVVVLLFGAGLFFLWRGSTQSKSDDELQRRMSALESKLDAEQQMTQQALDRISQHLDSAPLSAMPRNMLPELPPSPAMRAQQMQQAIANDRRNLEQKFAALTPAPPNDQAPQKINDAFENKDVLEASELPMSESVDCRSTMCLISARFAPNQDGSDWANRMLLELGDTLPDASVTSAPWPGGGVELHIYAARAGQHDPFGLRAPPSR